MLSFAAPQNDLHHGMNAIVIERSTKVVIERKTKGRTKPKPSERPKLIFFIKLVLHKDSRPPRSDQAHFVY